MSSRSFLLLQGVASPFFAELGKALDDAGHGVVRVNFCGGDWLIAKTLSAAHKSIKKINFRGPLEGSADFFIRLFSQYKITDIVLFGDTRPVHQSAIRQAKANGITLHVFEEGYLRPNWITLDQGGVNANSSLCSNEKNPDWFRHFANTLDTQPAILETGKQLPSRVLHDMRYHISSFMVKPFFPYYRTHRPETPLTEYIGWIKRFPKVYLFHKRAAARIIDETINASKIYYVLPLQLSADAQIKFHSPFQNVVDMLKSTICSFARHAPENSLLLVKNHPLDTGLTDYPAIIRESVKQNQLAPERIVYLESGNLDTLLEHARGTVLVNSTVGFSSLAAGCPTIALGSAIYDLPGLTYQGELEPFWNDASLPEHKPDFELFDAFRKSVIALSQINGDFYTRKGIRMAVSGSLRFLVPQQKPVGDDINKTSEKITEIKKTDRITAKPNSLDKTHPA